MTTEPHFELVDRAPTAATILERYPRTREVLVAGIELRGERNTYADDTWTRNLPGYHNAPQARR